MSFITAVEHQVDIFDHLPERFRARTQTFREEVGALLTDVPEPLRSHRILQVVRFSVHAASARERAKAQRFEVLPFAVHVADLLDGLSGFLQAPVSSVALRIHRWVSDRGRWSAVPRVMASSLISVGFIGLGSQGAPMARRIVQGGFPVTLWARRQESLEPFDDTAARTSPTPAALAEASSIVCLCVTGDEDVREVSMGADGVLAGMASGGILVVHSTVHPETCIRLREQAAENGVSVLDAPVSGGGPAAERGALLVMVGGEAAGLDRVRPVLATFGDPIVHLGDVGAGQTAKLVNNLVFTAQIALCLETFAFVDELGLDRGAMAQVFERGSGASRAAAILSASGFDISGLGQVAGPLLRKDVNLIADVARQHEVALPDSVGELAEKGLALPSGMRKGDLNERRHAHAAHQRNRACRSCFVLRRRVA